MSVTDLPDLPGIAPVAARPPAKRARRSLTAGLVLLGILGLIALLAPLIAPHDPDTVDPNRVLGSPGGSYLFGADDFGRDVLSRTIFALRVSLLVAVSSVVVASVVAVPLGLVAGYFGGWVDTLVSRPLDMILVLPALLLALSLITILGPGSTVAALAIAVIYLPILARVMRASTLVTSQQDYVLAARARGSGHVATMVRHVLPNSIGPVAVQASVLTGFALQLEAALSFLGLGTQPPTPSLGGMLAEGRDVLSFAPWLEIVPGVAIALAVLSFLLIGDGLRRSLDPDGVAS
jgi:peptide/nickel transport system permease protein